MPGKALEETDVILTFGREERNHPLFGGRTVAFSMDVHVAALMAPLLELTNLDVGAGAIRDLLDRADELPTSPIATYRDEGASWL